MSKISLGFILSFGIAVLATVFLPPLSANSQISQFFSEEGSEIARAETSAAGRKRKKKKSKKKGKGAASKKLYMTFGSSETSTTFTVEKGRNQKPPTAKFAPAEPNYPSSLGIVGLSIFDDGAYRALNILLFNVPDPRSVSLPFTYALDPEDDQSFVMYEIGTHASAGYIAAANWLGYSRDIGAGAEFILTLTSYKNGVLSGEFSGVLMDFPLDNPPNPPLTISGGRFSTTLEILN